MNLLVVVLGAAGSVIGLVLSTRQLLGAMKRKWQQDAEQTKAVRDNTKAVQDLTSQMAGLNSKVNDHERRLANGKL